jgi:hypothetical protein
MIITLDPVTGQCVRLSHICICFALLMGATTCFCKARTAGIGGKFRRVDNKPEIKGIGGRYRRVDINSGELKTPNPFWYHQ